MATEHFVYKVTEHAEDDLNRFSCMNMFEGKTLYLVKRTDVHGMSIDTKAPADASRIHMIALNGRVFSPK